MATINLTNKQLRLIQKALDFYSRIGILQLDEIISHPSIDNYIDDRFTEKKELEVGDHTMRGEIVEIGKDFIKTKGSWSNGEEIKTWTDIDKIKLSPDWDKVQKTRDGVKNSLNIIKRTITGEYYGDGANLGIHNSKVDESCRDAFDLVQCIRHEFWKEEPNRSHMTVDSSISLTNDDNKIEVKLDTIKDVRKQKIKKITK
jgi:hypothetical protein